MIYIASPYSHESVYVRSARFEHALRYTRRLMDLGCVCFSPIVYGHQLAERGWAPTNFEHWKDLNDHMMLASTEVHVLTIAGWEDSRGIRYEL